MDSFDLPKHDTQKVKRNFAGYEEHEYLTLEQIKQGDHGPNPPGGGMTESDENTSGKTDGPYTSIQSNTMGNKTKWPNKNQSKPTGSKEVKSFGHIRNPRGGGKDRG